MEELPTYRYRRVLVNSVILFIIANILETTLHECGHFLTAIALNAQDVTLHHNYVDYKEAILPLEAKLWISAAGPITSLFIGILFQVLCYIRYQKDQVFLFENYMAIFGYIGFFGYMMIAPFFASGDTGYFFQALRFPLWSVILMAIIAFITLYILMASLTRNFVQVCPYESLEIRHARAMFMKQLVLYPVMIGIVLTTLLNLPVITFLSLFAPFCIPFTILWTYPLAVRKDYPGLISNPEFEDINRYSPYAITSLVVIILMNRLLVFGLHF
ncbi:MAG: hypothetical protein HXX13_06895 [Bacteroidetes bacterium]|nr:hypothetical protein [Bacteroidota bacterium]